MKKFILTVISTLLVYFSGYSQTCDRDSVFIHTKIYDVIYSEVYQQPLRVIYESRNRPKNVDRGGMDFHTEKGVCTSDNKDYVKNVYDKGHLAPAATFSDSKENLYTTFSYLNCSLQDQYLNRGEWRLLEEQERVWDDNEVLSVEIILIFKDSKVLPTGGHVPTAFHKHIYFTKQNITHCYYFLNEKPSNGWRDHNNTMKCNLLH